MERTKEEKFTWFGFHKAGLTCAFSLFLLLVVARGVGNGLRALVLHAALDLLP